MNPTEQKNHKTRVDAVAQSVTELDEAVAELVDALERELREMISAERTHRLKLADEQRTYVDGEDRQLRQCCQERWDSATQTQKRGFDALAAFRDRTFIGRLRWLFRGI